MSPDILALARAYMALPGAHKPQSRFYSLCVGEGATYFRDTAGIRWTDAAGPEVPRYDWIPDLTDDATGGVMLGMLGAAACRVKRRYPAGDLPPWFADLYFSDRVHKPGEPKGFWGAYCATLAEACARVAVALGRAA